MPKTYEYIGIFMFNCWSIKLKIKNIIAKKYLQVVLKKQNLISFNPLKPCAITNDKLNGTKAKEINLSIEVLNLNF